MRRRWNTGMAERPLLMVSGRLVVLLPFGCANQIGDGLFVGSLSYPAFFLLVELRT